MIGAERLEAMLRALGQRGADSACRGRLVLEAQRQLYGSGASPLTKRELREIVEYMERRDVSEPRTGV